MCEGIGKRVGDGMKNTFTGMCVQTRTLKKERENSDDDHDDDDDDE